MPITHKEPKLNAFGKSPTNKQLDKAIKYSEAEIKRWKDFIDLLKGLKNCNKILKGKENNL